MCVQPIMIQYFLAENFGVLQGKEQKGIQVA
jgi:hypothetical protein